MEHYRPGCHPAVGCGLPTAPFEVDGHRLQSIGMGPAGLHNEKDVKLVKT